MGSSCLHSYKLAKKVKQCLVKDTPEESEVAGKSYFLLLSPCALTPGLDKWMQAEAWPENSRLSVKITNEDFN